MAHKTSLHSPLPRAPGMAPKASLKSPLAGNSPWVMLVPPQFPVGPGARDPSWRVPAPRCHPQHAHPLRKRHSGHMDEFHFKFTVK